MKNSRPDRQTMIQYLQNLFNIRGGSEYEYIKRKGATVQSVSRGPWPFCFNVKLRLLNIGKDLIYCLRRHGQVLTGEQVDGITTTWNSLNDVLKEYVFEQACNEQRATFVGHGGVPEDESLRVTPTGLEVQPRWQFMGRSNGWLVLCELDGRLLDFDGITPRSEDFEEFSTRELYRLYSYLKPIAEGLRSHPPADRVLLSAGHILREMAEKRKPVYQLPPLAITLQRQGISQTIRQNPHTLLTPGVGNSHPGFGVSLTHVGKGWVIDLIINQWQRRIGAECFDLTATLPKRLRPFGTLEEARARAEEILTHKLGRQVTLNPEVELYCPSQPIPNYPYLGNDIEFPRALYDEKHDCICIAQYNGSIPTPGETLISWKKGKAEQPTFTEIVEDDFPYLCQWRVIVPKAHAEFLKEHNQRLGRVESRRWLAWLISEYRKYGCNT